MTSTVMFYTDTVDDYGVPTENPIWQGKARVQQLRTPNNIAESYGVSSVRSFRFQLDPNDNPPFFNEGVKIRVIDGGRDPALELLSYVVNSSINSTNKAVRTVEARADLNSVPDLNIDGIVISENDELPLSGVEVRFIDDNNKLVAVTLTNDDGKFWLYPSNSELYELTFILAGYHDTVVDNVTIGDELLVEMIPNG